MAPLRLRAAMLAVVLPACFRPTPMGPERAVRIWRTPTDDNLTPRGRQQSLSLDSARAVALALRQGPTLREAAARIEIEKGRGEEDTQLDNPELRIRDVEIERMADGEPTLELALRLPIPRPWTLHARSQRANLALEAARARRLDLERQVRRTVRRLYARLAMLERDEAQTERAIELAAQHGALAAERVKQGAITRGDAALLMLRHAEALDRRHTLRVRRQNIDDRLRQLTGVRPDRPVTFRTSPADLARASNPNLDTDALVEQALRERRDLRAAAAGVGVAQADAYIARSRRWPWMRFAEVSYNVRPAPNPRDFEVALAVELPLLSLNGGGVARRDAGVTRSQLQEQALVLSVAREVRDAVSRVRETDVRLKELQRSLLPALEAGSSAASEALAQGLADPLRAMIVEWRRVKAQRRYLEAVLEHREAVIDLEAALGTPLPAAGKRR